MAWIMLKALPQDTIETIKAVREAILSSYMSDPEDDEGLEEGEEDNGGDVSNISS